MTKDTLLQILKSEKLTISGDTVSVPEDREATLFISGSGETIQVPKVVKLEVSDSCLCLQTAKDDRFWFTYELLLGLRLLPAKQAKDRAAGFNR